MPGDRSLQGTPPPALLAALRRLLAPLARLLIAQGVTHPTLAGLAKEVFVEVANRDFEIEGRDQTISRISLLTGIHRKEVKRLRESPPAAGEVPQTVSLGAQLVSRWIGLEPYRDARGRPRALPRTPPKDGGPSFESLVASVSTDIRPRAILDEWLRLGVASVDDEDRVRLHTTAFVPEKGFDEKAHYLGRSLSDHLAAAARNLEGTHDPLLERSVYYDELSAESVAELDALSRRLGEEALEAVNRRAIELQERDRNTGTTGRRMRFGVFFYEEPDAPPAASKDEKSDDDG